jgi:PAS domain S-box-containing protein
MSQAGVERVSTELGRRAQEHNAAQDTTDRDPVSAISTAVLKQRPSRPPNHAAENRALIALARELSSSPLGILQKLAETALALCHAQSAGISLLKEDEKAFHWPVIVGAWACHRGGGTPREHGPCGTVLDRNAALLFSHPERDFDYFAPVTPLIEEALLIPLNIDGKAVGTIWVIIHDHSRRFDSEDLRVMNNLGTFAAAAYQTLLALSVVQRQASIVDTSDDAIVSKDLDGIIYSWNRGAERIFGYAAKEIIGQPVSILIPPERQDEEPSILERIRRGERIEHYETVRVAKNGSLLDISVTVSPIRNFEGKIIGASKIARDITDRKQAEARVSLLASEMDHRAKNLLAIVQAAVHLTTADTAEDMKVAIEGRIRALAKAHALFSQSRWEGADLRTLVMEELAPYSREQESRADVKGPDVMLEPVTAQSMAVAVHELTTNAVKHGALSVDSGSVRVEWSRGADGQVVFRWSETGGPPVHPPTRQGFGSRAIKQMVKGQLNGDVAFDWSGPGVVCKIVLPRVFSTQ